MYNCIAKMKLIEAQDKKNYVLINPGTNAHFIERAKSMGLVQGTKLKMIRNQKKMPVLIYARDTLLAINQKDANSMEIQIDE